MRTSGHRAIFPAHEDADAATSEHEAEVAAAPRDAWPRLPRTWLYALAIALAAAAGLAILHYGRIQFGGEDGGILADIAWMGRLGYRPYAEIRTTGFPPAFVLPAGWAFNLLGVRWTSLVAFAAVFSAAALVVQTWLGERAGFGRGLALLLAVGTQAATMLPLSSWGYNQVTSVLGALYLTATLAFLLAPKNRATRGAFLLTAVGASWGKPNIAGLLLVGTLIAVLCVCDTRRTGPALLGLAAVLSCVLLFLSRADPRQVLASYLVASSRVTPGNFVKFIWDNDHAEALRTLALLTAPVLFGLVSLVRMRGTRIKGGVRLAVVIAGLTGIVTGIVGMGTNNDHNLVDAPLVVIGCMALAYLATDWRGSRVRTAIVVVLAASVVGMTGLGLVSTVNRSRIYSVGPGLYFEKTPLQPVGGLPMMADVLTGPKFRAVLEDTRELFRLNPDLRRLDAPVYFGPRLLVMYPEWGIAPPKGLPTWWGQTPNGDPRTSADIALLRSYHYDLMVFLSKDYTFYPKDLMSVLYSEFDVYDWRDLTIHVRKGATDVVVPPDAVKIN